MSKFFFYCFEDCPPNQEKIIKQEGKGQVLNKIYFENYGYRYTFKTKWKKNQMPWIKISEIIPLESSNKTEFTNLQANKREAEIELKKKHTDLNNLREKLLKDLLENCP